MRIGNLLRTSAHTVAYLCDLQADMSLLVLARKRIASTGKSKGRLLLFATLSGSNTYRSKDFLVYTNWTIVKAFLF